MEKQDYMIEYEEFMKNYKLGATNGEVVGEVIAHMAQYFAHRNMLAVTCERILNKEAAQIVSGTDENTGKPISVSKADIIIKATEEARDLKLARAHIENIEQYINALKYLQRGLLNEYSYAGTA